MPCLICIKGGDLNSLTSMLINLGTLMMSGCGILTNGRGTRREYGQFNLDEVCLSNLKSAAFFKQNRLHTFETFFKTKYILK